MTTTIQISKELKQELAKKKLSNRETYESVIWDLIEDTIELNANTKKELEESRKDIKAGKFYHLNQIKRELNIR
jgi:predicted transcriptional regulator